jgi:hypothetical protein
MSQITEPPNNSPIATRITDIPVFRNQSRENSFKARDLHTSILGYDLGFKMYDVDVGEPKFKKVSVELANGTTVVVHAPYNAITAPINKSPDLAKMALEFQKVAAVATYLSAQVGAIV